MSVIYVVLPLSLLLAAGAVAVFVWATRAGQFDDTTTPAVRVLLDDEEPGLTGRGSPGARGGPTSR